MDAVLKPEDEVIAFASCGQTYRAIVEGRGARLVEVPLDEETMLPDFVALWEGMLAGAHPAPMDAGR